MTAIDVRFAVSIAAVVLTVGSLVIPGNQFYSMSLPGLVLAIVSFFIK